MTQEEKELLLEDLCGRLPYEVKVTTTNTAVEFGIISGISIENKISVRTKHADIVFDCTEIKPYLRQMSSMTTDEEYEYYQIKKRNSDKLLSIMDCSDHLRQLLFPIIVGTESIGWLNAHHFDYRGLIPKGLALKAPEGMYKQEKQQ